MTITCARAEQIAFSTVYFEASQRLLVPKDSRCARARRPGRQAGLRSGGHHVAGHRIPGRTGGNHARRSELGRLPGGACSKGRRTRPAPTIRSWPDWLYRIPICTSSDRVWRPSLTASASTRHRTIWFAQSMPAWNGSEATGRGGRCTRSGSRCWGRHLVHQNRSIGIDMAGDEGTRAVLVTESEPSQGRAHPPADAKRRAPHR